MVPPSTAIVCCYPSTGTLMKLASGWGLGTYQPDAVRSAHIISTQRGNECQSHTLVLSQMWPSTDDGQLQA